MTEERDKRDSEVWGPTFWMTYWRLAREGACDAPGSMEFHRVYGEWAEAGLPIGDMEAFIRERANIGPNG